MTVNDEIPKPTTCKRYVAVDPGLTDEQIAWELLRLEDIQQALAEREAPDDDEGHMRYS